MLTAYCSLGGVHHTMTCLLAPPPCPAHGEGKEKKKKKCGEFRVPTSLWRHQTHVTFWGDKGKKKVARPRSRPGGWWWASSPHHQTGLVQDMHTLVKVSRGGAHRTQAEWKSSGSQVQGTWRPGCGLRVLLPQTGIADKSLVHHFRDTLSLGEKALSWGSGGSSLENATHLGSCFPHTVSDGPCRQKKHYTHLARPLKYLLPPFSRHTFFLPFSFSSLHPRMSCT